MTEAAQAPCVYPNCDDGTQGEDRVPRLTKHVICGPCRKRYAKVLKWLLIDYVAIKSAMPAPVEFGRAESKSARRPAGQGHPRSWASDTVRDIADLFNQLEDDLREQAGMRPAPKPTVREVLRVQHAYRYLIDHFEALCLHPASGDIADGLATLHSRIRGAMGFRRHFRTLPVPCPACDQAGWLTIGEGEGTDRVTCEWCMESIPEKMFDFFVRTLAEEALDSLIDEYDTRNAEVFAAKLIK